MSSQETIDRIISEFERDRDWRVSEFLNIKSIYQGIKTNKKHNSTYLSMCVPIIYAHWEGFCSNSFRIMCNFINERRLRYDKIRNSLFTYSNKTTYDYLKGKQGFRQRCKFSKDFIQSLNSHFVEIDGKFDAKSNLKFKVLLDYFEIFDINIVHLDKYKRALNRMVEVRNHIVHGENSIVVDENMVYSFIFIVTELFDEIILIFFEYLKGYKYLVDYNNGIHVDTNSASLHPC